MKFLLAALNAKYIHSNPALYSLRAYAEKYHPEAAAQVELAEYTINQTVEEILADLYERKPEASGVFLLYLELENDAGGHFRAASGASRAAHLAGRSGGILSCGGGSGAIPVFDRHYGRRGRGDVFRAFDLLRKKSSGRYSEQQQLQIVAFWPGAIKQAGLDSIAGIVYRDPITGELVRTKERSLTNISEIPFFYKDMKDFVNRIVYYESSRGCPFRCGYCLSSIDKPGYA